MKRAHTRLLALLLTMVMLVSLLPMSAFAAGGVEEAPVVAEETADTAPVQLAAAGDLTIPGYNQVTQLRQLKAGRQYLVVAQGGNGLYALYPRLSAGASAGALPGANAFGLRCAKLTVSGSTVTAVAAASQGASSLGTSVTMDALLLDIAPTNGKYTFTSHADSAVKLNLNSGMFTNSGSALNVEVDNSGVFTIKNVINANSTRFLSFSEYGTDYQFSKNGNTFGTDFWGPDQKQGAPVYIFIQGELPVEPGMDLANMLTGDQIGGGDTADENPGGQNSWVFTGGRAAQGSFADIAGARAWTGHFEEYVRYTHAKQFQPSGEATTPYFQRHVINAAYTGQTLQNIVDTFDTRIVPLKSRAVVYLADEGAAADSGFSANLDTLITKSLALRNGDGMLVVATLTAADQTAVETKVNALSDAQKRRVLPVAITLTDAQKTGGYPNALGHLEMAKKLADAVAGTAVSTAANWPYGAITNSVMDTNFPNKTPVEAHHTYEIPSTLSEAQRTVQTQTADKSAAMTWLFMGDSITHGSAWTGGYDTLAQLFEKFVKDDLGRGSDVVINAGSSGATTASTISDLNRRLVKYAPDVVVVMLGTNDVAAGVSESTFKANIRTILNKIMDKGAVPVLRTPPPSSARDVSAYAGYIRDVAAETDYAGKVILVDQFARWEDMNWGDVYSRQNLHPDEAGHLWFVHQLVKELALWNDSYRICQLEYVEMNEPDAISIPGYTQLTNLNQLDETKGYLIVSQDAAGGLYALYPSQEGETLKAGDLVAPGATNDGARAAGLTVSGNTVTAKWLKDNSALEMEKLLFSIQSSGEAGKYIFTAFNGRHLNMQDYMFTEGSVALTVTNRGTAALNAFEIANTSSKRFLDFTKNGDPNAFGDNYGTDFWAPKAMKMAIYLFASDTVTVPTAKETIERLIREDATEVEAEDHYTRASWAAFQTALTAAQAALASGEADGDAEVYVTARDALQSALDNLQARPVIPTVPEGANKIEDWHSMVPGNGTTTGEPFQSGTAGSNKFRIPAIITLQHQSDESKNGRLVSAIDARWNHTGDACGLDTISSYSDDNGSNWKYTFPNYFGDGINAYAYYGSSFIDPVLLEGQDGTIYLMVDIWPGGIALNTAPNTPTASSGCEVIDGEKRLVLYTSPEPSAQSDTNYSYYVGDFAEDGYAPVYAPMEGDDLFVGFYIDRYYYIYYTAEANFADKTPANDRIFCQRLGDNNTWVQQNVFFYNSTLHVRNASYLWIVKSTDGGETWVDPQMINAQVHPGTERFYGVGPGAGLCMEDGTLLLPIYIWPTEKAGFIYSKDNGETWQPSPSYAASGSSESCVVQIDETTVRHFYRDSWNRSLVPVRYTDHTWDSATGQWVSSDPIEHSTAKRYGACQVSAIKYSRQVDGKDVILYSSPANGGGRSKGIIHAFLVNNDENHTMELYNTYSVNGDLAYAYSSLTETENGNIALLYESTGDAVIFKVIPIEEILPSLTVTGYEGSYDGQSHAVTVTASQGATLQYSTDGGATWTSTNPTFTTAGTHTVKVKATWTGDNWSGSVKGSSTEAEASVVIGKVTPTLSITTEKGAIVAPGQEIVFTVSGVPADAEAGDLTLVCDVAGHGAVTLTRAGDGTWTGTHDAAEDASTHNFTVTLAESENYETATATYQVQVVDIGVTIRAYSGTYDGQPHSIRVTPADGVTVTYCETEDGDYTETLPAYTDAGTYTTYYKAVKEEREVMGYAHVTIARATPAMTIVCGKGTDLSTEDLPITLTVSGVPAEDQGQFSITAFGDALRNITRNANGTWTASPALPPVSRSYTFDAIFDPTQTQAGEAIASPNYERGTVSVTVTVTRPASSEDFEFRFAQGIAVDEETPSVGTYTVIYDGQPHSVLDALVCEAGATLTFHTATEDRESGEPTWTETAPTFTQPGTYAVSCMATKGNSAQLLTVRLVIEERVIPVNLTLTANAVTLTGGGEVTLTVTGAPEAGTITLSVRPVVDVRETSRGKYTVTLPNATQTYTFTAEYSGAGSYQPATSSSCRVSVNVSDEPDDPDNPDNPDDPTPPPVGPTTPSQGTSSSVVSTETRENEDGTTTKVVTDKDGTVTETTKKPGGVTEVVETKPDGTVTETTTQFDGTKREKVTTPEDDVTITVTDKNGEEVAHVEIPATVPPENWRFDDVPATHWADEAIHKMAALEVVNGTGGNNYSPVMPMNRASLATVLFRLSEGKSGVKSAFADVESGQWYAEAVAWAAKAEVVKGVSETEFAPEQIITREQLATMLCRYAGLLGLDTGAEIFSLGAFADGGATHEWAAGGMAWCVEQGILQGKGSGRLDPTADVSRAEVAVMLERFMELLKK